MQLDTERAAMYCDYRISLDELDAHLAEDRFAIAVRALQAKTHPQAQPHPSSTIQLESIQLPDLVIVQMGEAVL